MSQCREASVVSHVMMQTEGIEEILLHTGQHFDANMSEFLFNQLGILRPDIQLDIHGGSHGEMTGRMLMDVEQAPLAHKPNRVFGYGDTNTNSTLAGALAVAKLHIPVVHVGSGLRSFNMQMPKEVNRILTDQISDFLFCPTTTAVKNLENEGLVNRPFNVMQGAALSFAEKSAALAGKAIPEKFILATLDRA